MTADDSHLRLQVDEHPLIQEATFATARQRVLHLLHERAYDEAVDRARNADVLDLGCNTGYGTVRLAAVARTTVGADVNAAAIDKAKERDGAGAVDFRVVDGGRLPFPDSSFDLVTSFQTVEHIVDPRPYVAEVARVLRIGGVALFTTPNAAIRLDPGLPPWYRFHAREYRADELPAVFGDSFGVVDVRGMFARDDLYLIEFERVDAARRRHSEKLRRPATAAAKKPRRRTPEPIKTLLRPIIRPLRRFGRQRPALASPPPDLPGTALGDASTANFWYARENLDRALDLLAVCTAPRRR